MHDSWNLRNVGLTLFSTLVHRSLSPSHGSQDFYASRATLATRQPLAMWDAKYPSLVPFITDYLHKSAVTGPTATHAQHSPLFPILIIIRSLRWSPTHPELPEALVPAVVPYLGSAEWQVSDRGLAYAHYCFRSEK